MTLRHFNFWTTDGKFVGTFSGQNRQQAKDLASAKTGIDQVFLKTYHPKFWD